MLAEIYNKNRKYMALEAAELAERLCEPARLAAVGTLHKPDQEKAALMLRKGMEKHFRGGGKPTFVAMDVQIADCFRFFSRHKFGGARRAWLCIVSDGMGFLGFSIFQENMAAIDPKVRAHEARACAQVVACSNVIKRKQFADAPSGRA